MSRMDIFNKEYYINRELSWLEFNQRVLDEAGDMDNPLFERLKFLAIVSSNLDEFFMVRVGSLHDQINAGFNRADSAGLTPKMQLAEIAGRVQKMMADTYRLWNENLVPGLKQKGIRLLKPTDLNQSQKAYLDDYFDSIIYPVLTPMAVDSSRPFPLIQNKTLNIAVLVENIEGGEDEDVFSTVQVPSVFSRMIALEEQGGAERSYILLEDVISMRIDRLFAGKRIKETCTYRVTRNGDLAIDEDEAEDLLLEIEKSIKQRRWGQAVLLELEAESGETLVRALKEKLEIQEGYVSHIDGPLDPTFLFSLYEEEGLEGLKYEPYVQQPPADLVGKDNIFDAIRKNDILLHHPFESFDPIVDMIKKAARDPKILAIKQTLYRVSGKSPIIRALAEAADLGKQVTVLVELKARFDEENNIHWAKSLEKAGCHVIYGLIGLKTHCKITLFVRMEDEGINRYVHLSTGNYNDETAKIYTDIGLLTCNKYFAEDASTVFNALTGFSERPRLNKLVIAPTHLRNRFFFLIEREIKNAREGKQAYIKAKLNSLVDTDIIGLLYEASCAGVRIELIVRGMCCLKPGIRNVSENIEIRSIVGRYLEHSRIYCFCNGGDEDLYISSADWMERNLDRRVELLIPLEDKKAGARVRHILDIYLRDNVKARRQDADGRYKLRESDGSDPKMNAQEYFMKEAVKNTSSISALNEDPVFKPRTNPAQT